METETIFKNAGHPWSQEEDTQLNKLYNEDLFDIMEISKIHNRAPGGIISRLFKNNYIVNRQSARGYINYKNSDLYKEIVSNNKKKIEEKPKEEKPSVDSNKSEKMSKKYPNITKEDAKEISSELDRLCGKYPENKQFFYLIFD